MEVFTASHDTGKTSRIERVASATRRITISQSACMPSILAILSSPISSEHAIRRSGKH